MKTFNTLHLRVQGGLCNRLRAMASGLKWRGEQDAKHLVIHWNLDREMNAPFARYFEVPAGVDLLEREQEPWLEHLLFSPRFKRLTGWHSDYVNWLEATDFSWVKVKPEIEERVRSIQASFPRRCVGVHVRRTDNAESIRRSPMEAFYWEMDRALAEGTEGFFLASDSEAVKSDLRARYGQERIVTCDKVAAREDPDGLRDAVVDLMLLASTEKIIGSFYSSFSETAAAIGGIECLCATC